MASQVRTFPGGRFGRHLRAEFTLPGAQTSDGRILALAHSDTVWPLGTLAQMPLPRERAAGLWGPGVLDMKSGIAFFLYAVRALRELDIPVARRVVLQVNSDEEVGSETSRQLTEEAARHSAAVLVLEPGTGLSGKIKTARKGVGRYKVTVHGRASHAGVDFENGASAVVELARQIERIAGFTNLKQRSHRESRRDRRRHAQQRGGGGSLGRCGHARSQGSRIAPALDKKFHGLRPFDKRCSIQVEGGMNRPPMERTPAIRKLFRNRARLRRRTGREAGGILHRRRLGRKFHGRHGRSDARWPGRSRRRRARRERKHSDQSDRGPHGAAGDAAVEALILSR